LISAIDKEKDDDNEKEIIDHMFESEPKML